MRAVVLTILLGTMLLANTSERIVSLYDTGDFRSACLEGSKILRENRDDEVFLNAYSMACLKSDFIDLAGLSVMYLRSNKTSRANASYILTVVLQKKLLYHALADNIDLDEAFLPDTPHILSKVYNAYAAKNYTTLPNGSYQMQINGKRVALDSYVDGGHFKIRIRQYAGATLEDEHIYW